MGGYNSLNDYNCVLDGHSKESFRSYYKYCLKTIKDMFGLNTKKYNIMKTKLDNCKNETQLSNVMTYGRMNLL